VRRIHNRENSLFNLLKMEGVAFEILSGKDQIRFIRDVIKHLKYKDLAIGMVLREISLAKNNLIMVSECVFRSIPAADSGRSRPPIPIDSGQPFRRMSATYSGGFTGASVGNILNFQSMFQSPNRSSLILIIAPPPRYFVPARISSGTTKSRFKRRLKREIPMVMMSLFLNHPPRKQRPLLL